MRRGSVSVALASVFGLLALFTASSASAGVPPGFQCTTPGKSYLCADIANAGHIYFPHAGYVGHDEPSLLFYSNLAGAGNNNTWQLTLPKDPTAFPVQGMPNPIWNFQEHPAFWFGMAMCDSMSYPQFTTTCNPATDANIFDDANSNAPGFIGHHPGTAFMELQFYPPGWVPQPAGNGCGATTWCAALNIDSLSENGATGAVNGACSGIGYPEYINFAFVTRNGVPTASPSPLDPGNQFNLTPGILYMHGADKIVVSEHDTFSGLETDITDLTTGQSGHMVSSAANGFQQIDPVTCAGIDYNFHPMYSTSTVHTRVPWTAHSYNIAYSDEIGHFDYCNGAAPGSMAPFSACTGTTEGGFDDTPEAVDLDETTCASGAFSALVPVDGCVDSNAGFDGASYATSSWPGNGMPTSATPQPVKFKSPYINNNKFLQFSQVGFETDLPRIEVPNPANPNLACIRATGVGCTNPPLTDDPLAPPSGNTAQFYPIFAYATGKGQPQV